jgi:hypothetical protein
MKRGELTIGDFADVILDFYKALPKDLFEKCAQVKNGSTQS